MHHVSLTPFGRQPVTPALLAARQQDSGTPALPRIDKWSLFNDLRRARKGFGLTDRDLSVLYALLTFLPAKSLDDGAGLVVFPSNASLSDRAHGMAESTLRRHLAALVGAGLIRRQDSPNGKRYARRDRSGQLSHAYGFDLRPLLVQADRIAALAAEVMAVQEALHLARETLVLRLRDCAKLLAHARDTATPGPWDRLSDRLQPLRTALRRKLDAAAIDALNAQAADILRAISDQLALATEETAGSAAHFGRHHTNSNKDSSDSESRDEAAMDEPSPPPSDGDPGGNRAGPSLSLNLVVRACPDILPYAQGALRSWRDLIATASVLRGMMGISAETWTHAQRAMGAESAAIVVAAILQNFGRIANPGGYLRALATKATQGRFSTTPMILSMLGKS